MRESGEEEFCRVSSAPAVSDMHGAQVSVPAGLLAVVIDGDAHGIIGAEEVE